MSQSFHFAQMGMMICVHHEHDFRAESKGGGVCLLTAWIFPCCCDFCSTPLQLCQLPYKEQVKMAKKTNQKNDCQQ